VAPADVRLGHEQGEHGRHEVHHRHAVVHDQLHQRLRIAVRLRRCDNQAAAGHEGQQQLPDRHVERGRCLLQQHIVGAEPELGAHPGQPVRQAQMGQLNALGLPGRA
jgi:hypothetical protein